MTKALSALVFMVFLLAAPASAQSRAEIALKVERLEREMVALENRLRNSQGGSGVVTGVAPQAGDAQLLSDLVAKFGTLERQVRAMNGRLEELEYRQRKQDEALELIRKEMQLQARETAQAQAEMKAQINTPSGGTVPPKDPGASVPDDAAVFVSLPDGDPAMQYRYAFNFIQKNDLENGFKAMDMFLKANPDDERVGNAKFWLGRIHLLQGRMPQAAQQLLALIEEHPNHDKRPDALLDLADVLIALDSAQDACNALSEFRRSEDKASERLKARAQRTAKTAGCAD
ncbi:tetratricopeptide repeat protein [Kordiimonas sp.]|uniref:tetratricopeptide repeat protein n=1 Tax=Kordiimonas sp. TaxID=1970157 RepID=UPI003A8FB5AA